MQLGMPILSMHSSCKISANKHYLKKKKRKRRRKLQRQRVEQRTSKHLPEQLAEQAQLEIVQMAEQETARQLIAEASQKLSAAVHGTVNNLQCAKVAHCTCAHCTCYAKCG